MQAEVVGHGLRAAQRQRRIDRSRQTIAVLHRQQTRAGKPGAIAVAHRLSSSRHPDSRSGCSATCCSDRSGARYRTSESGIDLQHGHRTGDAIQCVAYHYGKRHPRIARRRGWQGVRCRVGGRDGSAVAQPLVGEGSGAIRHHDEFCRITLQDELPLGLLGNAWRPFGRKQCGICKRERANYR